MSDRVSISKEHGIFTVRWSLRTYGANKAVELEVLAGETTLHCWRCLIGDQPSRIDSSRSTLMDAMQVCATELDNWLIDMRERTVYASNYCGRLLSNAVGGEVP